MKATAHSGRASGEVQIPPGARTIDVRGKTVCRASSTPLPIGIVLVEVYLPSRITTCVQIEIPQNGLWGLAQKEGTEMAASAARALAGTGKHPAPGEGDFETGRLARLARLHEVFERGGGARHRWQRRERDGYAPSIGQRVSPSLTCSRSSNLTKAQQGRRIAASPAILGTSWAMPIAGIDGIESTIWSGGLSSILDLEKRRKRCGSIARQVASAARRRRLL